LPRQKTHCAPETALRAYQCRCADEWAAVRCAGDGEIDRPLLDLLQQNIDAATAAGQAQAAEFMTKVRAAAMKFLITA